MKREQIKSIRSGENKLFIFPEKEQYVLLRNRCGTKYCSLFVMSISDYDLKDSVTDMIMNIIRSYLKSGFFKKGSTFSVGGDVIFTPYFIKPVYLKIREEILEIVGNFDNYRRLCRR